VLRGPVHEYPEAPLASPRSPAFSVTETHEEDGFTLLELVIALSLSAIIFTALAATLGMALKALSVQKTRSQGNELATQGIEDLQRYDFSDLGVCPSSSDPSPSTIPTSVQGLVTVQLPNCSSSSLVYVQPCAAPTSTLTTFAVPRQTYTCTRNTIVYSVSRFIVWADATQTGKRLAVYVSWRDAAGAHQVAQESSLRSPNSASVIGVSPPQFVSALVTAPNSILIGSDGTLQSSIVFTASTLGLGPADSVSVTLNTLVNQADGTLASVPAQFALSSGDGNNWMLGLPGTTPVLFGQGTQYVTFTEVRSSGDGKANSRVASRTLTFCPSNGCSTGLVSISNAAVSPTSIDIDTSGVLQSTFTVSATTANVSTSATVTALVQTQTGASSLQLQPSTSCSVGASCNSWSLTVAPGTVNFRFSPGGQVLYVTATEPVASTVGVGGSSAVLTTNTVTFA
jgi:prepilin-type N-terminal cleavage/methylation domain-containing protein